MMVLQDDFESFGGSILHHTPLSNIDLVNELLIEEIRFMHSYLISNKGTLIHLSWCSYSQRKNLNGELKLILMNVFFAKKNVIGSHNVNKNSNNL